MFNPDLNIVRRTHVLREVYNRICIKVGVHFAVIIEHILFVYILNR